MNAVEIEEAVSALVAEPFDAAEFGFQFITAFGAKKTTVDRLRRGDSNQSDIGGVLQRNNIHIAVAPAGEVGTTLAALRASPKTVSAKAKFILATDGDVVEAEDLVSGDVIAGPYVDLPRYFATFLPLAGISTVKEIKNNPIDVKATGRLNRLYVELLKDNPDWATEAKRPQLNQFMAQLIFCFFAEDTDIFPGNHKFTPTVERMTSGQADDTQAVIAELFRAMGTRPEYRAAGKFPTWADGFPYVNGGYLFNGETEAPYFGRTARAYLLRAGELDWKEINPDIFGSMIQAVADDGERGELGMHYTSVPNILKVLNPLLLDSLREQLETAGESKQRLRSLRKRLAGIRVFDPACGSGNFLVIAYKEMRSIEATIVDRLGGEKNLKLDERRSVIPLDNFYGIEIKGFAAEIARLALLIAEFQADCVYLSQQEARAMVLPLHKTGQITVGNALRLDWLVVCPPPARTAMAEMGTDGTIGQLAVGVGTLETNAEAEIYICGNPPYKGNAKKSKDQESDLKLCLSVDFDKWRSLDYICGWFYKAAIYQKMYPATFAFVATNSISQGQNISAFWQPMISFGIRIVFAVKSFQWSNLASKEAGVSVVVVGCNSHPDQPLYIFDGSSRIQTRNINPYLIPFDNVWLEQRSSPAANIGSMLKGNYYGLSEGLLLTRKQYESLINLGFPKKNLRRFLGGAELIDGTLRYCLWIPELDVSSELLQVFGISERIDAVRVSRLSSPDQMAVKMAKLPHQFREMNHSKVFSIAVPTVSSERRTYIPADIFDHNSVFSNMCFALYDAQIWNFAILSSQLHLSWISTVCGKLETRIRYSNTLGWNTFPVPKLTDQNKIDLTRTAENILLAREAHFPATIADLYDPDKMPNDLRRAHDENDEVLERIYIGRRFRNDTERLEKLFDLYSKMTADAPKAKKGKKAA
jgi:hypothetical protein